jgi:hypothetical protein
MPNLETDDLSAPNSSTTPNALLIWDNKARLSLPPLLAIWLAFLVVVCLASIFFVRDSSAARWVLGGLAVSHLVVFLLPAVTTFTMRRGFVSLMHVVCWTPGLIATIADVQGRQNHAIYEVWSYALIAVVSISFLFGARDACTYLCYVVKDSRRSESH